MRKHQILSISFFVFALLLNAIGVSYAQSDTAATEPSEFSITGATSFDYVPVQGPLTSTVSTGGVSCVKVGYNGSSSNLGLTGGVSFDRWDLRLRYSNLSGYLNDVNYEFRTLGAEIGYRYPLVEIKTNLIVPLRASIGIGPRINFDVRLSDFQTGFDGALAPNNADARSWLLRGGIGIDCRFEGAGFRIGPEYQFKYSPFSLAGDPLFGSFGHYLGLIGQFFIGKPAEAAPAVSPSVLPLLTVVDENGEPCSGTFDIEYWDQGFTEHPPRAQIHVMPNVPINGSFQSVTPVARGLYYAAATKKIGGKRIKSEILNVDNGTHAGTSVFWRFRLNGPCH